MIKIKKIDHVCLIVLELVKTKKYYESLFGFICKIHPEKKDLLIVESSEVHFFFKKMDSVHNVHNNQHLSFEVENIKEVIEELNKNNITTFETGVFSHFTHTNYKWIEWRDPNGIRLECIEKLQ